MKCFKNIKKVVLFLLMAFMCAGIGYSQSLLEIVKTVKEARESFKKAKSERNNVTQKSLNNGVSENSESESLGSQNIVTLIVSADGSTKDEATKIALRSAIEQTYGTFVSNNTTILNDELVKDEIVTVSSGNIVEYKEISCEQMPGGKFFVTLQATVSISKLISYAQSKGAETEFAGATFGMNMKMKKLNKKNEEIALKNLAKQIIALYPSSFSYNINVSEPKIIDSNNRNISFGNYSVKLPEDLSTIGLSGTYEDYYISSVSIGISPNQQMNNIIRLILTTVNSLALSEEEKKEYEQLNMKTYNSFIFTLTDRYWWKKAERFCNRNRRITFRSDLFAQESGNNNLLSAINLNILKILNNFQIVDNLGNVSKITSWRSGWTDVSYTSVSLHPTSGTNLLSAFANYSNKQGNEHKCYNVSTSEKYLIDSNINLFDSDPNGGVFFEAFILFPKNEISKYSNFRVEQIPVEDIKIEDPNKLLNDKL